MPSNLVNEIQEVTESLNVILVSSFSVECLKCLLKLRFSDVDFPAARIRRAPSTERCVPMM